ncbi:hypothetical protein [uncultured Methanobrevibacter sp.]|nr:hypothetical protein [uncultured Methanobrevibacter sp.]
MSEDDEKIIKQDKLLFKLMMHTYDDENKRSLKRKFFSEIF